MEDKWAIALLIMIGPVNVFGGIYLNIYIYWGISKLNYVICFYLEIISTKLIYTGISKTEMLGCRMFFTLPVLGPSLGFMLLFIDVVPKMRMYCMGSKHKSMVLEIWTKIRSIN